MTHGTLPVLAAIAAAAMLLGLAQFASLPAGTRFLNVLNNFAHGPVFGTLALVALYIFRRFLPDRPGSAYAAAFGAALAAGLAIEVLQIFSSRDASWADVATDALGAGAALCLHAYWVRARTRRPPAARGGRLALIAGLACVAVLLVPVVHSALAYATRMRAFPTILQFRTPLDLYFVELRGCEVEFVRHAAEDPRRGRDRALRIRFIGDEWPGLAHAEPVRDWRGFARLRVEVENPAIEAFPLGLRVHEIGRANDYDDRFNRHFTVDAGAREVLDVPLAEIAASPAGRPLDLGRIGGLALFRASRDAGRASEIIVTRIWLE